MEPNFLVVFKDDGRSYKNPISKAGKHKRYVTLLSFFLDNKPKKKEDILIDMGLLTSSDINECKANVGSYYSNYFQTLAKIRVIRYDSVTRSWVRGENYLDYITFVLSEMLLNEKVCKKIQGLMTEEQLSKSGKKLRNVVEEILEDHAVCKTLKRIWRANESHVVDFIINSREGLSKNQQTSA